MIIIILCILLAMSIIFTYKQILKYRKARKLKMYSDFFELHSGKLNGLDKFRIVTKNSIIIHF